MAIMMWLLGLVLALLETVLAADPTVKLPYISLQGKYSSTYNLEYYRKIPYAAPPIGPSGRFNAPKEPQNYPGIYNSDVDVPGCPQNASLGSEDCLYLGLYAKPWQKEQPKRPVMIFFHGGGWIRGIPQIRMPPSGFPTLNVSEENDWISVYPSFRLNVFGLLPGKKTKDGKDSVTNAGLRDQEMVLKWVQQHINKFGGDPEQVTIWGQSSGGGGVAVQVLRQAYRTGPKLFQRAILSSPYYPRTLKYDSPEAEGLYDELVDLAGCKSAPDSLQCLKTIDAPKLQSAALNMTSKYRYTLSSFTWAPVIDGDFLVENLSEAVAKKKINTDLVWSIYNAHEGENFISPDFNKEDGKLYNTSEASFDAWVSGFMPKFNSSVLTDLKATYPDLGEAETFGFDTTYVRAGLVYRDVALSCPALWIAKGSTKTGYVSEYTVSPAKHASDTGFWNTISALQSQLPWVYRSFTGGLASFIQTGSPNLLNRGITAPIPAVDSESIWLIEEGSGLHRTPLSTLEKRCNFWFKYASLVPI